MGAIPSRGIIVTNSTRGADDMKLWINSKNKFLILLLEKPWILDSKSWEVAYYWSTLNQYPKNILRAHDLSIKLLREKCLMCLARGTGSTLDSKAVLEWSLWEAYRLRSIGSSMPKGAMKIDLLPQGTWKMSRANVYLEEGSRPWGQERAPRKESRSWRQECLKEGGVKS